MITATTLESEWLGNLRPKPKTIQELTDWMLVVVAGGPDEAFFATLELTPYHLLKRQKLQRYFIPLTVFVWRQAVLATIPGKQESFGLAIERGIQGLHGVSRREFKQFINDLNFFKTITDLFAEEGFLSVALHVVQRVHGEIEQHPDNLVLAVALNQWLDEQYQLCLEQVGRVEIIWHMDG